MLLYSQTCNILPTSTRDKSVENFAYDSALCYFQQALAVSLSRSYTSTTKRNFLWVQCHACASLMLDTNYMYHRDELVNKCG